MSNTISREIRESRPTPQKSSRRRINVRFYEGATLATPYCRMVVVESFANRDSFEPDANREFVAIIHPVICVEARIEYLFWAFEDEQPNQIGCSTIAGFTKAGFRLASREVVHGATFVHKEFGLISTIDAETLLAPLADLTIIACQWDSLYDQNRLAPTIAELKSRAMGHCQTGDQ